MTNPSPAQTTTTDGALRRSHFFIWIAVAMLIAIALGFGKSFYLRPAFTDKPLPAYLITHGVVMTAWYLLFLAQACLVNTGRSDLHRKFGIAGVALAIGVAVTGVIAHLNFIPRNLALGFIASEQDLSFAIGFALAGISSFVPFVALIALAVWLRRKAAVHKRLMFWAMVWTIGPAFTNTRPLGSVLDSLTAPYLPFFPSDIFWLVALMAYDWKTLRRIHPATYITFLALALWFFVVTGLIVENSGLQDGLRAYVQTRA